MPSLRRRYQDDVARHIIPHRGNYDLMYDWNNLQSLCFYHHGQKTAKEVWRDYTQGYIGTGSYGE